jgi:hypothetical protein
MMFRLNRRYCEHESVLIAAVLCEEALAEVTCLARQPLCFTTADSTEFIARILTMRRQKNTPLPSGTEALRYHSDTTRLRDRFNA